MPTTVVKSIGTSGRDYSTLQAWEDAAPANLVTADQIWRGECYNDSEFTAAADPVVTISGSTSDATRYKELTAASGQSFQDHASVRSNRLDYDQTVGVGVKSQNANYSRVIVVSEQYVRVSRLQLFSQHSNGHSVITANNNGTAMNGTFKDLVCRSAGADYVVRADQTILVNVVMIQAGSGPGFLNGSTLTATQLIGCTIMRTTNQSPTGVGATGAYANSYTMVSCALFGFASLSNAKSAGSTKNASDLATGLPGTGNQHSVPYSGLTPFTQGSNTNTDARAIAGTLLIDNGTFDVTNAPNDVSGTARDATPTIGAWEVTAAVAAALPFVTRLDGQRMRQRLSRTARSRFRAAETFARAA